MTPALTVSNLSFEYSDFRALDDVSFDLAQGSVTALVGPNGAGKTTLLRCMAGLETPTEGAVSFGPAKVLERPIGYRTQAAYLPEAFGLYDSLSVKRCLAHFARAYGIPPREIETRLSEVAEEVGVRAYFERPCGALSRGQRQRVGLAICLLHRPKILFLDEPAANLDPESRAHLSALIRTLAERTDAIVVSSHILSELEDYCDHMLLLRDGRLVSNTSVDTNRTKQRTIRIRTAGESDRCMNALTGREDISAPVLADGSISFSFAGGDEEQQALLKKLIDDGIPVLSFTDEKPSLERAYLEQIKAPK